MFFFRMSDFFLGGGLNFLRRNFLDECLMGKSQGFVRGWIFLEEGYFYGKMCGGKRLDANPGFPRKITSLHRQWF